MSPVGWAKAQVLCFPRGLSLSCAVPTRRSHRKRLCHSYAVAAEPLKEQPP